MSGFFLDLTHSRNGNGLSSLNLAFWPRPIVILGTMDQQNFDLSLVKHISWEDLTTRVA